MPYYFMRDTPLQALEQLMMSQPGQKPRGGGIYRSPFHYTPKDVACEYCQNYDRKHPCRLCECTCLAERIEAGVLEMNEFVRDCFAPSMGPQFRKRMHQQLRERNPQFFLSNAHRRRWTYWRERCWRLSDRNKAALFLLTAYESLWRRMVWKCGNDGFDFQSVPLWGGVKIAPKSSGVGQYQHSVDQGKLKARLNTVVESCVNRVGVNINTASKHILTYISGLGPALAENIVAYRAANGDFKSRKELLRVPRLGAKAYELAAGFLRIVGGQNPLDNSAVHPESYHIAERMAADAGVTVERLLTDKQLRSGLKAERYVSEEAGLPTVTDILEALDKRGLDPREQLQVFAFDPNVHTIGDLREGMLLPGIVTNITAFGAFVDIGVKQDGLVHISQLADRYVASPADVVHLGQHVEVRVTGVDTVRGRIALSMRREA